MNSKRYTLKQAKVTSEDQSGDEEEKSASKDKPNLKGYYVVEKILDKKWSDSEKQWKYKIKWMNYPMSTWEPKTNLFNVPLMIRDFETEWNAKNKDDASDSSSNIKEAKRARKPSEKAPPKIKKRHIEESSPSVSSLSPPKKTKKKVSEEEDSESSSLPKPLKKRKNKSSSSSSSPFKNKSREESLEKFEKLEKIEKEKLEKLERSEKIEKKAKPFKSQIQLKTASKPSLPLSKAKKRGRKSKCRIEEVNESKSSSSLSRRSESKDFLEEKKIPSKLSLKETEMMTQPVKKPAEKKVFERKENNEEASLVPPPKQYITPYQKKLELNALPHKENIKIPREQGNFIYGDNARKIKLARPEGDEILCLVEWFPRKDGFQPKPSYLTNSLIKEYDPLLLVNYYEAKIKFNAPKEASQKSNLPPAQLANIVENKKSTHSEEHLLTEEKKGDERKNFESREKETNKVVEKSSEKNFFEKFLAQEGFKARTEQKEDQNSNKPLQEKLISEESNKDLATINTLDDKLLNKAANEYPQGEEKRNREQDEIEELPKLDIAHLIAEIEENNKKID